ncbi:MAG TPA: glycerate kinase [Acidimicrobiales bacterium]|nr:glycerate kinase [Acidimicrobiales bacterium]
MPRLVAAPDKFRGTATAAEVAAAIERAAVARGWTCDAVPVADGGEGTLAVLGGGNRTTRVTGPLGSPVDAAWRLDGGTAVIEMAQASGLMLAGGPENNDALDATTYGTGELILAALEGGARRIVVAVGGSATTDGGLGALRAIGSKARLRGIDVVVACDVTTRFVGAATEFAEQKGATAKQVQLLERRLDRLVDTYVADYGVDVRDLAGAGAAGGLAGGLAAIGAALVPGFDVVADRLDLEDVIEGADLVVTGEGYLDAQSFRGKAVGGVVELAAAAGVAALVVVGDIDPAIELPAGRPVVSLVARVGREQAMADTAGAVEAAIRDYLN